LLLTIVGISYLKLKKTTNKKQPSTQNIIQSKPQPNQFDFPKWQEKYGKHLKVTEWSKQNPLPWGSYFGRGNSKVADKWYVQLGPLGIKTRMHDQTWGIYSGFQKLFPPQITDNIGLVQNAFEVLSVDKNGPANKHLQKGDLIIEIEHQPLKSAENTFLDRDIYCKNTRGLEISAGQLIDEAEGRGKIALKIIRVPKNAKLNKIPDRKWQTVASKTMKTKQQKQNPFKIDIPLNNCDQFRIVGNDGGNGMRRDNFQLLQLHLENAKGEKIPLHELINIVKKNGYRRAGIKKDTNTWNVISPCQFAFKIPTNSKWTLKGSIKAAMQATIQVNVDVIKKADLPTQLQKYTKNIEFEIPQIGSFGKIFEPNCPKMKNYSKIVAHRLAIQQEKNGSWAHVRTYAGNNFHTSMCGLALLATGDPQYSPNIKKAAYFVATNTRGTWAYPRGVNIMFLAEYYLRTHDTKIIPYLNQHLIEAEEFITSDYTAGHKHHPGYNDGGWIGAGGALSCGFAIASYTPAKTNTKLLDKMLTRIQELAPNGQMPYTRSTSQSEFNFKVAKGQRSSSGTGPYFLASLIRGGTDYFTKIVTKRYNNGPWGDAGAGHATHTLTFVWACLGVSRCSPEAHKGNMEAFLWKFVTHRDFSGLINSNTNRLEYHGAEACIGNPYWRTAGFLLLLNAHKKNMAITGDPRYNAKTFRKHKYVTHSDRVFWKYTMRNWNLVEAKLHYKCPNSLKNAIKKLRNIKQDQNLGINTIKFIKENASQTFNDILKLDLPSPEKQYLAEMIIDVGQRITVKKQDKKKSKNTQYTTYEIKLVAHTPFSKGKTSLPKNLRTTNPVSMFDTTGTITIVDPTKKYLKKNCIIKFSAKKLKTNCKINLPNNLPKNLTFNAIFHYKTCNKIIRYIRPIIITSTDPMQAYNNYRQITIKGTLQRDYVGWSMPITLKTGEIIPCAEREYNDMWCIVNNKKLKLKKDVRFILKGTPCEFKLSSGSQWECYVHQVKILKPNYRMTPIKLITITGGKFSEKWQNITDNNQQTAIKIKAEQEQITINIQLNQPTKINAFSYKGNISHKYYMEYKTTDGWKMCAVGGLNGFNHIIPVKSGNFRIVYKVNRIGKYYKINTMNLFTNP